MGKNWHIGRKAIIAFLSPFLDLPEDLRYAWQKVRRWKRRYGLPIGTQPNGHPYIDEDVFEAFWVGFEHEFHKKMVSGQ